MEGKEEGEERKKRRRMRSDNCKHTKITGKQACEEESPLFFHVIKQESM